MNLRVATFSVASLGLLALSSFSFAQGVGSSTTFPLSGLLPSLTIPSSTTSSANTPASSGTDTLGGVTLSHQDSTKPVHSVSDGGSGFSTVGTPGFGTSATPEPGTWALMITGFSGGLIALRRRKK